ncbi:MAG: hypothetical protein IJN49_08295 [Clostridia bacterium]|nr:hypothetical protein [Clostridia bacterium]
MTVSEVLEIYNEENQNDIPKNSIKLWISELDKKIAGELNKNRVDLKTDFYSKEKDDSFVLNAPEQYDEIYSVYLKMKTDYYLGETERYNNSAKIYNHLYFEMGNFISRNFKIKNKNFLKVGLNGD